MSDSSLREALEKLAASYQKLGASYPSCGPEDVAEDLRALLAAHPAGSGAPVADESVGTRPQPTQGVPDDATFAAVRGFGKRVGYSTLERMRDALEAARPYLGPEVVVDHRPGETCSVAAEVDPETGFAVRPLPTREQIAEALQDHYPTAGATVASGVTCQCGYWNGNERPGVDRPAGAQGRDGLDWHRAQVVLALLSGSESCLGDGVCTNPKCPVHGIKEEPSDQPSWGDEYERTESGDLIVDYAPQEGE